MSEFAIAGGVYLERCIQPLWNAVYGSGGRAAHCVASLTSQAADDESRSCIFVS
jgi:hypothetical protein